MSLYQLLLVVTFVVLIGAALMLFRPPSRSRPRPSAPADRQLGAPAFRDDDRYWYGGVFYYNPDDPDPIVPRRYGFGWTVNIGHPLGKLFIAIMVALILLPLVLAIVVPGFSSTGCHPSHCHL